jgi:transitional endoplasmic reticulum ATPase
MSQTRRPEVSLYKRNATHITSHQVLHELEKQAEIEALPFLKRKQLRANLEAKWAAEEASAVGGALEVVDELLGVAKDLSGSLDALAALKIPDLLGKVEGEQLRLSGVQTQLEAAHESLKGPRDFGAAGAAVDEAARELWHAGGPLVVVLNQALSQAAIGKEQRAKLQDNVSRRQAAKSKLEQIRRDEGPIAGLLAAVEVHRFEAQGFLLAAEILGSQVKGADQVRTKVGRDTSLRVIQPQDLETFDDVGGLEEIKDQLRSTVGTILERPDEAARYHVVHNGILFHGPPGTGKTLLSRALAGEYGMRYIRFSPASIASAYVHEAAANLHKIFEIARENVPCLLFLDEVDTIASARDDQPSADHREVVTQLMTSLEEFRNVPGLVIAAATNSIDRLDPGLREGRFDTKILVPLPDPTGRASVIKVHLDRRGDAVDWSGIDLEELARQTHGRNAAALEGFVSHAAQGALRAGNSISQEHLMEALRQREGKDRVSLDIPVTWGDVVLPEETREQLMEMLNVFAHPELARSIGVSPPAGILLYGPPGTGKTTIARAMATELAASFYELSAADLLSKWVGESEERVKKLFSKARANRPSIIFIDEIDALLRRRSSSSGSPWEERVISQFLSELDGLHSSAEGVLLVGATNRLDIIDPAISGRRLTPVEVALPDAVGRMQLLRVLCKSMKFGEDVDLKWVAAGTEGMSGADLKRLRDAAGMKALSRVARTGGTNGDVAVLMADIKSVLEAQKNRASLVQV